MPWLGGHGEWRGWQGRGEPGTCKVQLPSLTFCCICYFLLGTKALNVPVSCFNDLRSSHMPRGPQVPSPSLGRFPAQPLHLEIARMGRVPLAWGSAPQIPLFTEPREPHTSWKCFFQDISSAIWQAHEIDGVILLWDHTSRSGLEKGVGNARPRHGDSASPGTSKIATASHKTLIRK